MYFRVRLYCYFTIHGLTVLPTFATLVQCMCCTCTTAVEQLVIIWIIKPCVFFLVEIEVKLKHKEKELEEILSEKKSAESSSEGITNCF